MKKVSLSIFCIFLAGVFSAQAQTKEQPFGFKLLFGLQAYVGDLGNEITDFSFSDPTYGLGLAYYINRNFDASLGIKWMTLDYSNPLNDVVFRRRGASFSTNNLNLNLLLHYKPFKTKLNPYVAAGIGLNFMKDRSQARKDPSYTVFSIPLGVGVNYKLRDHIMINVQWLYNRAFSDAIDNYPLSSREAAPGVDPRTNIDARGHDDYFTLTAGIIFTFGREEEKKPAAGKRYRPPTENETRKTANMFNQAHQLNDQTLTALKKLQKAVGQKPEQSRALKAELIHIVNNIQFVPGKADLIKSSHKELNSLAAILQVYSGLSINIAARAGEGGSKAYNKQLSLRRGQSVKKYLVSQGVSASRITVTIPGKATFSTTNAQNRSVQFTLYYTGSNTMN